MLGWTQAEPEWDDTQRNRMLALGRYRVGVHPTCGMHDSIARKNPAVMIEDEICPICRDIDAELRARAEHESESDKATTFHASDGRMTTVRLVSPAEVAERRLEVVAPGRR